MRILVLYFHKPAFRLIPAHLRLFHGFNIKTHTVSFLADEDRLNSINRNGDGLNLSGKSGLKGDHVISKLQAVARSRRNIEDNFMVRHLVGRYNDAIILRFSQNRKLGSEIVVHAPFVKSANEVRSH